MSLRVEARREGSATVLAAQGRIDFNGAAQFRAALEPHVGAVLERDSALVLDLGGVDYISSAGLRELLIAAKRFTDQRARLLVCNLQPVVQEVIRISRFDLVLQIVADLPEALRRVEARP